MDQRRRPEDHELKKWTLLRDLSNEFLATIKIAKVSKYDSGKRECAFLITSEDKVFVLGDNYDNMLAIEGVQSTRAPIESKKLSNRKIIEIVTGHSNACALTLNGEVLTWGSSSYGMLGNGSVWIRNEVHLVQGPLKDCYVRRLVMSKNCVLCLAHRGKLFGWGENYPFISQFASTQERAQSYFTTPLEIKLPQTDGLNGIQAIHVADHTKTAYILTTDGRVFAWGSNEKYLLGVGPGDHGKKLCRVQFPEGTKIKTVCPGSTYTLSLSQAGDVFFWGETNELEHLLENPYSKFPTKILVQGGPVKALGRCPLAWNRFILDIPQFVFSWDLKKKTRFQPKGCKNIDDVCASLEYGMLETWQKVLESNEPKGRVNHVGPPETFDYNAAASQASLNFLKAKKVSQDQKTKDAWAFSNHGMPENWGKALEFNGTSNRIDHAGPSASFDRTAAASQAPMQPIETKNITSAGHENIIGDRNQLTDNSQNKTVLTNSQNVNYKINLQQPTPSAPTIGFYSTIPRNNLTDESATYVGMNEYLRKMDESLAEIYGSSDEFSCAVLVLHGMAGSGKSTLADAFMRKKSSKEKYKNRIVINAESMETIKSSFLKVINVHNFETKVSETSQVEDIAQAAYRHLLPNPTLIVFDGASQFNAGLPSTNTDYDLTKLLPFRSAFSKNATMLVTTRVALTTKTISNVREIRLAPLSLDDSLKLTDKLKSDFCKISTEDREKLVKACGYNPLAIKCCMEKINNARQGRVRPNDLDSAVILKSDKLASITREFQAIRELPKGYEISSIAIVRAALDVDIISSDYLKQIFVNDYDITEKEFYEALELLRQFSVFDGCSLPLVSMNYLMRVACTELFYPLVAKNEDIPKKVMGYLEYVLVQQMSLSRSLEEIATWSDVVIMLASSTLFSSLPDDSSTKIKLITVIIPQLGPYDAKRCWSFFEKHVTSEMWTLISLQSATVLLSCLLNICGWNSYSEMVAKHLFSSKDNENFRGNSLWYRLLKVDHWLTGKSHFVFKTEALFKEMLKPEWKNTLGINIQYYLKTLAIAGSPNILLQQVAPEVLKKNLNLQLDIEPHIDVATVTALAMQGKDIQSREICSRRMKSCKSVSLMSLNLEEQLACLLLNLGDFTETLKHIENLLTAGQQFFGPTGKRYLRAVALKARVLRKNGSNAEALAFLESTLEVLKSRSDVLRPDNDDIEAHPFVLYLRQCIGEHFYKIGQYPAALVVLQNVFDIQLKSLGPGSFYTLESMYMIGLAQRDSGNIQLSLESFSKLMAFSKHVRNSERNAYVLKYAVGEAATLIKSGERINAEVALELIIKYTVEEELWIHWCEARMLLAALTEGEKSKSILEQVFQKSVELMGPQHKNTLRYQLQLVKFKWLEGNLKESETEIETVLKHMVSNHGEDNVSTLPWLNLKALVLCDLGKVDEALRLQKKVVEYSEKRLETCDHPEVFRYKYDLCLILGESGRETEALDLLHDLTNTTVYSKLMKSNSGLSQGPDEFEVTALLAYLQLNISPPTALVLANMAVRFAVAKKSSSPKRCIQIIVNYGLIACALQKKDEATKTIQYARSLYADQPQELEAQLKVVVDAVDSMDTSSLEGAARLKFRRGGIIEWRSRLTN